MLLCKLWRRLVSPFKQGIFYYIDNAGAAKNAFGMFHFMGNYHLFEMHMLEFDNSTLQLLSCG